MSRRVSEVMFDVAMIFAVMLIMIALVFGLRPIKTEADTVVKDYSTRVVLTSQTLVLRDGGVSYDDTFESWIGDLPCEVWSWDVKDYLPQNVQFYGTGDEYLEPYEIVDDGVVGDIYDVIVHTNGTVDKSDDEIEIVRYVGYVSF